MTALNDEDLLKEFVAEGREHLSSIEPDLLILERDAENTDPEIINRIFRAIHSIKGASGFFGLQALKALSHSMENTLMMLRDGQLLPSGEVMDPLLLGVDRLRLMLEDIQASEAVTYQDVVVELEKILEPKDKTPTASIENDAQEIDPSALSLSKEKKPAGEKAGNDPNVLQDALIDQADPQRVEQAMRSGQKLYRMELALDEDFYGKRLTPLEFQDLMASTGVILSSKLDMSDIIGLESCLEATLPWSILYASVLDADLIAATFDLSASQFREVNYMDLFPDMPAKKELPPLPETKKKSEPTAAAVKPQTPAAPILPTAVSAKRTFRPCLPSLWPLGNRTKRSG